MAQQQASPSLASDEDDPWSGEYTWHWKGLSKCTDKVYTANFELGTYVWRILAFAKGNQNKPHLSFYLDAPESNLLQPSMYPDTSFTFTIVNRLDESKSWSKEARHKFVPGEQDWGFTETIQLDELFDVKNGWMVDDDVIIKLQVSVLREDVVRRSRMPLGCVGLQAQEGHMGHMNPVLQYLYHLPLFRKAVYGVTASQLEGGDDDAQLLAALAALQSMFFKLQYCRSTVSTQGLGKSFSGWDSLDAFMHQGMQDLHRLMGGGDGMRGHGLQATRSDEDEDKGSIVSEMFEGHTITHVKCINTGKISWEERQPYTSLKLDVQGCLTLYEAFDRYTATLVASIPLTEQEKQQHANANATPPTLEAMREQYKDLKMAAAAYMAATSGERYEERRVLFESFPPVLQLQLERSPQVPHWMSFPLELDLDRELGRYLSPRSQAAHDQPTGSGDQPGQSRVDQSGVEESGVKESGVEQLGVDQSASQPASAAKQQGLSTQQGPPHNQYKLHSILLHAPGKAEPDGGRGGSEGSSGRKSSARTPVKGKKGAGAGGGAGGGGGRGGGQVRVSGGGRAAACGEAGPSGVGAQTGGWWQACVAPDGKTWLSFEDESVTRELKLGKHPTSDQPPVGKEGEIYITHAHMLVYVRKSDWDRIMCPVSKDDVSPCVLERLEVELSEEHYRQQDKLKAHMYINVRVATDHDIQQAVSRCPYGLLDSKLFDFLDPSTLDPPTLDTTLDTVVFRVKKDTKFGAFRAMVSQRMGVNLSKHRLWLWGKRPNDTYRTTTTLNHIPDHTPLIDIKEITDQVPGFKCGEPKGALYKRKPATTPDYPGPYSDVFVFVKYYDPHLEVMRYVGKGYFPLTSTGAQVAKHVAKMEDTPPDVTLEVWEEIDFDHPLDKGRDNQTIKTFGDKRTLLDRNLKDGSILVVQPKITVEAAHDIKMPTCRQYMQYVRRVGFAVAYEEAQAKEAALARQAQTLEAALAQALLSPPPSPSDPAAAATGTPVEPEVVKEVKEVSEEEEEEDEPELPPPEKRYDWELELMQQDQH